MHNRYHSSAPSRFPPTPSPLLSPSASSPSDKYEELKVEAGQLEQDRDTALADFESLEKAFADLHQRYFKLKSSSQALQKVPGIESQIKYGSGGGGGGGREWARLLYEKYYPDLGH